MPCGKGLRPQTPASYEVSVCGQGSYKGF
jgi:hypothetical protein